MYLRRGIQAALSALLLASCAQETFEVEYGSYAVAKESGAFERGWLPAWLPPTATRIFERHNIDTNARMWVAQVPLGIEVALPGECQPIKSEQAPKPPFERQWWPPGLPYDLSANVPYYVFQCGTEFVGLAAQAGKLAGWALQ